MNWRIVVLLTLVLLAVSACSAPPAASISTADGDNMSEHVDAAQEESEAKVDVQPIVSVYKSPTCGCCGSWIEHMEEHGFVVEAHDTNDLVAVKNANHVPSELQSCHTAIIDGYVIEGHVPADDIGRLLANRPDVAGLAVPGMPVGSPGMEVDGYPDQPFDVIAFDQSGNTDVFASHNE